MAFSLEMDIKATVEIVVSRDKALSMKPEEYREYITSVNPDKLIFKEGCSLDDCTKFVLRKVLPFRQAEKVMNKQMEVKNGKPKINLSYIMEEIRASLIDIINPINCANPLEFKRGSDGMASEELIAGIHGAGVLMDLFSGRTSSVSSANDEELGKKN